MKRTSFVATLAALLLIAGGILWHGAGITSAASVQPDATSLALVPVQATSILGVDVDGLRSTPIYSNFLQKHPPKAPAGDFAEFVAATGFDPQRDVSGVTAGGWKNGTEPAFVAVVTAHYNSASVAAFVKSKGAVVETYNGFELIEPDKHPDSDRPADIRPALVFLDDSTILAGTNAAVKQALDLKTGSGSSVLANPTLLSLVSRIGAQNQIWGASTAPGSFLPVHATPVPGPIPPANQAKIVSILQGLQTSTFGINAAADVNLTAASTCANAADAQSLADTIRGLLAIARMMVPPAQPGPVEILNTVQVVQNNADVRVTAQVPADVIQQFMNQPETLFHKKGHRD